MMKNKKLPSAVIAFLITFFLIVYAPHSFAAEPSKPDSGKLQRALQEIEARKGEIQREMEKRGRKWRGDLENEVLKIIMEDPSAAPMQILEKLKKKRPDLFR